MMDGHSAPDPAHEKQAIEEIEIDLLLSAIARRHDRDFREYHREHLSALIRRSLTLEGLASISALQGRVLHDPECAKRLLSRLVVTDTAMFRDPEFYRALRRDVIPQLRAHPSIRIWHAGCSTGEEVYSLAIVLAEEGLYERCRIYATDVHEPALKAAMSGTVARAAMPGYEANYLAAGGNGSLFDYFSSAEDRFVFREALQRRLVFAPHNLATDGSLNEFHLVLCRNVLRYFGPTLQRRVHTLLHGSLRRFGILALGHEEPLDNEPLKGYESFDERQRLFRRRAE